VTTRDVKMENKEKIYCFEGKKLCLRKFHKKFKTSDFINIKKSLYLKSVFNLKNDVKNFFNKTLMIFDFN
jgi:hypothetical protein